MVVKELKNEILVGNKPLHKYLVTFSILSGAYDSITIKARGKYIQKAIYLAKACTKLYQWNIDTVRIDTEEVKSDKVLILPSIEIYLKK